MPRNSLHKFYLSIVLPSVIAILLFVLSLYLAFLPAFETAIMNDKKEMISELTNTVWSLIDEYDKDFAESKISLLEAQHRAIESIAKIRYGSESKDYFWIIDQEPKMIMHPYRPDLEGSKLDQYADPNGKTFFVDAVQIVAESEHGFVDYMWQWKDDETLVAPKLSYVKSFQPWGWIIGTGIYLDDVQAEIAELKKSLLRISLIISSIITFVLLFVIRQSLLIERKKMSLNDELLLSKRKYKALVEASNQGILMLQDEKIIFSNNTFSLLSGYNTKQTGEKSLQELLQVSWQEVFKVLKESRNTMSLETDLFCADGSTKNVVAYFSKVQYSGREGYIISIKEITKRIQIEGETTKFSGEVQNSLLLMKQPIKQGIRKILSCPARTTIQHAAQLLARKQEGCIFVKQNNEIIGIVTASDFVNRALAELRDLTAPVTQIMTAPLVTIDEDALLYQALLQFNQCHVGFLAATNKAHEITGVISFRSIASMQQNTVSYFVHEIDIAESIDVLVRIHNKVPALVFALIESGDKTANITGIITSISDAITKRIIELAIEKYGSPPCKFAYMVMGSEGRMEQTLSTDQDNAIIFEDVCDEDLPAVEEYFMTLGNAISDALDEVGFNYCSGGIMASNPLWNRPYSRWKTYFDDWISTHDLASIVEASIFFDFRGIYGDLSLTSKLRAYVTEAVKDKSEFLQGMAESVSHYKSPVGAFGNIVGTDLHSKDKSIDIKMVLMPVIKFCRLYALRYGFEETNTLQRIAKLYETEIVPQKNLDALTLSYNYLMQLRFRAQARAMLEGKEPTNKIDVNDLTHIEIGTLKDIFAEVNAIPSRVHSDYKQA